MGLFDFIDKIKSRKEKKKDIQNKLRDAEQEMYKFLTDYSNDYIYEYSYKGLVNKYNDLISQVENYRVTIKQFYDFIDDFKYEINRHNKRYLNDKISEAYKLIGDVEGHKLDPQQMACIVKNAENHVVIAGAGTGKTTTIIGKVKYLMKSSDAKPEDFLILSYTNAAVDGMRKRLLKETGEGFYVATFHKLGMDIIKKANSITPNVYSDEKRFVQDFLENNNDSAYLNKLAEYLLYHNIPERSEFSFSNKSEYTEYLKSNPPTTIKDEIVKSYGEMKIANFLAQHGIEYKYEADYIIDTRTEEYGQYKPDFYLPDYNIYIEYFGIDREGNVPPYFRGKGNKSASEVYQNGIKWKRELHKKHGTRLVECYAYENFDGILLDNLKKALSDIEMRELLLDEIVGPNKKKNLLYSIAENICTVITLSKNRRLKAQDLYDFKKDKELVDLIVPVFNKYNEYLKENDYIDFSDMLNMATDLVKANKFQHSYKYVIVDEYQDISFAQYQLLKAMRNQSFYSIFCVGDDWQSIYRFSGSDIGYILKFDHYWGDSEQSKIETTYRFSQRLIDISSEFITRNPNQIKKNIRSGNNSEQYVLGNINGYNDKKAIQFVKSRLNELPKNSSVFFIGRYNFDKEILNEQFEIKYNNENKVDKVYMNTRPDLNMTFYTAHRSKGLQADYVFIINNKRTYMGFPSKVQNPAIIESLLEQEDGFPDSEERRLFYVAMTRAKKRVFLVTYSGNISTFADELISKYESEIDGEAWCCPLCGCKIVKKNGPYGEFYGCSNYKNGCKFTRNKK